MGRAGVVKKGTNGSKMNKTPTERSFRGWEGVWEPQTQAEQLSEFAVFASTGGVRSGPVPFEGSAGHPLEGC